MTDGIDENDVVDDSQPSSTSEKLCWKTPTLTSFATEKTEAKDGSNPVEFNPSSGPS